MGHSSHLITIAEALQRVFLPSFNPLKTKAPFSRLTSTFNNLQCLQLSPPISVHPTQCRHASISRMGGSIVNSHGRHGAHGDKDFGPRPDRPLRDEEIKAWKIHMVASDGKLTDLQILTEVLSRRECDSKGRPTQFLQEVAPATLDRPNPICRMYEKKASREIEEAKRKATKTTKMQTKQLEVSWAMSDNDLGHRLARLKEFLEKGWRVEVVFGSKRKGWMNKRAASAEEAANVLERIKGAVGEVEGANEWRGMQGKIGGEGKLSFEGPKK